MSAAPASSRDTVVVGYILPPKQEAAPKNQDEGSDDEDEEEEEEDPEFLDMGEMESLSAGGLMFQSSAPLRLKVKFQILGSYKTLWVEGRFPLTDPWWLVTCRVRCRRNDHAELKGFPSYALRSDIKGEESRSLVALFLKACGVIPEHVTQFMEWLPKKTRVGLDTLPKLLEEFEEVEQHKAVVAHMKPLVSKSVAGRCVHAALHYPLVMKHLPTLLPRKFKEILGMGKRRDRDSLYETFETGLSEELLEKLEEIINTDVWKLGFSYILYKELNLIRCEARLEAFVACGLFRSIPELQQHALQVYEQLNRQCQLSGSTYVERSDLEGLLYPNLAEVSVWAAVHFLKEQGVVVFERQRVALQNLHCYEVEIGKRLGRLVRGDGETEPWRIQLDVWKVLREAQEERQRARAQAEAGKNTPGEESTGAVSTEQNGQMETETGQERANEGPSNDSAYVDQETSTQAIHSDGGSWGDLNFDLTCSAGIQEVAPAFEEPSHDHPPAPIELDPDQVRAAEMICSNPVTVISGKGGCGKTTVVSLVFKAAMQQRDREMEEVLKACEDFKNDPGDSQFLSQMDSQMSEKTTEEEEEEEKKKKEEEEEKLEVLLTAPTGRAAGLLTKRTGFTAYTMHQVLVSYMNWKRVKDKGQGKEGEGLRWKFRRVRALVVDEGSLVSVQILHSLLSILTEEARLQKFVLLGDVRQLPSIEPGSTLHDLFHSLRRVQWSIEMRTNHRAESQLIVDNAGYIADMGQKRTFYSLDFDAVVDMNYFREVPAADKRFIYVRVSDDDTALNDAISLLLRKCPGLQDHQISQFIAFRRSDCALINELCCKYYVDHTTKSHNRKMDFRVGDKICCTRNSYVTDRSQERHGTRAPPPEQQTALAVPTPPGGCPLPLDPLEGCSDGQAPQTERREGRKKEEEEKERVKERLCNGEIFYITEDVTLEENGRRKRRYLTLDDGQGRELCVLFKEVQRLCRIRHAWARTIHTFQGSEADTIVYVVGSGVAQDWRHVYTAVTRGQKRVYVVSKDADLEKAIRGHVRKRNTRLGQLVRELFAEQRSGEEDLNQTCFTQPCLDTPPKKGPGLQASQALSQTPGPYSVCRDLKQENVGPDLETRKNCLEDNLNFSQAWNWRLSMEPPENCAASQSSVNDAAVDKEKALFSDLPQSPLVVKRVSRFQGWNTPPKQLRVASAVSPTGASSLGLLTLNSPSPAPVVEHLFPRKARESAATPSPVKFRPKIGLSQRLAAAAVSMEEGRGGGDGPNSSHHREASPSRTVPGCDGLLGMSNSNSSSEDTNDTFLQDDLAFTQEYSWPPMSGEDDDPLAVPHGNSVQDGPSKEIDVFLKELCR